MENDEKSSEEKLSQDSPNTEKETSSNIEVADSPNIEVEDSPNIVVEDPIIEVKDNSNVELKAGSNIEVEDSTEDLTLENNPFANVKIERRSSGAYRESEGTGSILEDDLSGVPSDAGVPVPIRKLLNSNDINPMIKVLKENPVYPMEARASELEEMLNDDDDYEFDKVLRANNDDAHAFGQPPISFLRKILAVVCYPRLLADNTFPEDVKSRARHILRECKGHSIGSVTDPAGLEGIRKHVAKFIEKRDDIHCKWQDVFLTPGSGEAIKGVLKLVACQIDGKRAGVMLPVPAKLIYRLFVQKHDMQHIDYYLNEENNWSIDIGELNRAYDEAILNCNPRAIIVINPGHPTGTVLTKENIEEIIKFAYEKQLLICADEVHQFDIFIEEIEFFSFKKVLKELGYPYSKMELASFTSASGGFLGESGLRGGYVEFINVAPDVQRLYLKYIATKTCPPVLGQVAIEVLVNPPLPNEPSYDEYISEKSNIIELHRVQAAMVTVAFNNFPNFSCTPLLAGRHAFPRINFPATALKAAEEAKQSPDLYYTLQLLEQKGICVSPGCEFGQKEDTYHFSIALVLPPDDLNLMLGRFKQFNQRFNETFLCKCKRRKPTS